MHNQENSSIFMQKGEFNKKKITYFYSFQFLLELTFNKSDTFLIISKTVKFFF